MNSQHRELSRGLGALFSCASGAWKSLINDKSGFSAFIHNLPHCFIGFWGSAEARISHLNYAKCIFMPDGMPPFLGLNVYAAGARYAWSRVNYFISM